MARGLRKTTTLHGRNYPTGREIDLILFGLLFVLVVFYELQNVWPFISAFRIRELLYLYLLFRILTVHRLELNWRILPLLLFFLYAGFVAVHTWLGYGTEIGIKGLMRWVSTALIAPIALVLIRNMDEAKKFFYLWGALVAFGAMAAPYQCFGGELDWLVRGYASYRESAIRFKTLLGEPNVGGMAGALVLAFGLISIRSALATAIVIALSFMMIVFSVSKAALAGGTIVAALSLWHGNSKRKRVILSLVVMAALGLLVIFLKPQLGSCKITMLGESIKSFFGITEQGAARGLHDRVVTMTMEGSRQLLKQSDSPTLAIMFGGSFVIAGSAAVELGYRQAMLPHNSFTEVFLVGGAAYLLIFVALLAIVYMELRKHRNSDIGIAAHICFLCSVIFGLTYPVIYAPALGALFWMIVGVSLHDVVKRREDLVVVKASGDEGNLT